MKTHALILVLLTRGLMAPAADLPELFTAAEPGVVEIVTSGMGISPDQPTTPVRTGALGSGFLIAADGLVMTAAHVVQTADSVAVRFSGGEVVEASIVASQPNADVALLRVVSVPASARPLQLGDSDAVRVGERIAVIGAPLGVAKTLTVGYVSAKRFDSDATVGFESLELIQTDAAINQGNSGGPMLTMGGEVVGIVSHIVSQTGGSQGLGFAVSSNLARRLLLETPSWWSGMSGTILEDPLTRILNVPQPRALLVEHVATGSPASMLGIRPGRYLSSIAGQEVVLGGDVILSVQGVSLAQPDAPLALKRAMLSVGAEGVLEVEVLRGGQRIALRKATFLLRSQPPSAE